MVPRYFCLLASIHGFERLLKYVISYLRDWEKFRADSRLAPSQCETSLQSNAVSHWLGANLESAPKFIPHNRIVYTHIIQDTHKTCFFSSFDTNPMSAKIHDATYQTCHNSEIIVYQWPWQWCKIIGKLVWLHVRKAVFPWNTKYDLQ